MTYKHKRGKCAKETKEILEDVLRFKEEEYGCVDCAKTVNVGNPIEKIVSEEASAISSEDLKSQAEQAMDDSELRAESPEKAPTERLESYSPSKEVGPTREAELKEILDKDKKKRAYIESKKLYTK